MSLVLHSFSNDCRLEGTVFTRKIQATLRRLGWPALWLRRPAPHPVKREQLERPLHVVFRRQRTAPSQPHSVEYTRHMTMRRYHRCCPVALLLLPSLQVQEMVQAQEMVRVQYPPLHHRQLQPQPHLEAGRLAALAAG